MGYSLKTRCLVLAGWLAAMSPIWCCCVAWGGTAGQVSAQHVSVSTEPDDCTGCPAEGENRPAESHPSQPSDPCPCEQQHLDVDRSGSDQLASLAVVVPIQPVLIHRAGEVAIVSVGSANFSTSCEDPPSGKTQSLFALSCLLLV